MEAATTTPRTSVGLRRFLASRRGALTVAMLAAAAAAIALAVYLGHYRTSVRGGAVPTQVLVANRLIPAGTSGTAVATGRLFRPTTVSKADVEAGALTDAARLADQVATRDIYPGQQIVAKDFREGYDKLRGGLSGAQRAFAMPVDQVHGLVGDVRSGDQVDVITTLDGRSQMLARDVLVLKAPGKAPDQASDQRSVIIRVTDAQATALAGMADEGKIWFALRAPTGATESR